MTEHLTCPQCNNRFHIGDRSFPDTPPGSEAQILYCSETCKRKAQNRRYYLAHREEVKSRVIAARKAKRPKEGKPPATNDNYEPGDEFQYMPPGRPNWADD